MFQVLALPHSLLWLILERSALKLFMVAKFTLSALLIILNYPVIFSLWSSTTVKESTYLTLMMTLVLVAELWFSLSLTTVLALGLKFMLCVIIFTGMHLQRKYIHNCLVGWSAKWITSYSKARCRCLLLCLISLALR